MTQFGEMFLAQLCAMEMAMLDGEVESAFVEISKSDRATCFGCRETIAAVVAKLLVKFVAKPDAGKEEFPRSFHLGCSVAKLQAVEVTENISVRHSEVVRGFILNRCCIHCVALNDLKSTNCAA